MSYWSQTQIDDEYDHQKSGKILKSIYQKKIVLYGNRFTAMVNLETY